MNITELQSDIRDLKKQKDVTILAHYYQQFSIQEIADFLGDSLSLSRIAKEKANTKYIIFAGVIFMAETASILNQNKKILIPSKEACCSLANYLNGNIVKEYKREYPEIPIVTYVNTTAEVKAESDICCTSSNSVDIVRKISEEFGTNEVLFGPDKNLAEYAEERSGLNIVKMPGDGHCYVHSYLSLDDIKEVEEEHPKTELLVHPECNKDVRDYADYIGSTAGMYNYVKENQKKQNEFIIGTERGLLERMAADFPQNRFYIASEELLCDGMKQNNLHSIKMLLENLENEEYEVRVPEDIAKRAMDPIQKMLEYSI